MVIASTIWITRARGMHVLHTSLSTKWCPLGFKTLPLGKDMDEETAERIFDRSTLTGFYKTEIRPCKATPNSDNSTTRNNIQQGMQTDAKCNIQQCCVRLHAAFIRTSSARTLLRRNKIKYTTLKIY